jgi:hypothetical protein
MTARAAAMVVCHVLIQQFSTVSEGQFVLEDAYFIVYCGGS